MVTRLLVVALVVLGVLLTVQTCRLDRAHAATTREAYRADSLEAVNDTTRNLALTNARVAALLGDSLTAVQRRAVQTKQQKDALDVALGLERRAKVDLEARVRTLEAQVQGTTPTTETPEGVRSGTFHLEQPPYTVDATAHLPTPPTPGRLDVKVGLAPAPIQVRLGCGPKGDAGVRPAQVTVTGPPWLTLNVGEATQAREVCADDRRSWWTWGLFLVGGYGFEGWGGMAGLGVGVPLRR